MNHVQDKVWWARLSTYQQEVRKLAMKLAYYHPMADKGCLFIAAINRVDLRCRNGE